MKYSQDQLIRISLILLLAAGPLWPTAASGQSVWKRHHGPEGGTVTALAIDPQTPTTLYAGIKDSLSEWSEGVPPSGELFKTTDGGRSWRVTNTDLPNIEITAIFISPHRPTTIYVGVASGQIFKSVDGGGTWSGLDVTVGSAYPALSIARLAFDPQTQTTIYAAGGNSIVKSTDGGSTWRTLSAGLPDDVGVSSIAIDPKTPTTLYAGLSSFRPAPTRGVFKSTDGGETWRSAGLTDAAVVTLAIDPQTPTTLYAGTDGNSVFKTIDGGETWRPAREGLSIENVYALAVDPQKPMTLYAGFAGTWGVHGAPGGHGVFKSTDGGAIWRALDTDPANSVVTALVIDPRTPSTTVYMGTEVTGIFKSTNGGASWRAVNNGLPSLDIVPTAIDPQRPNVVYSLAAGVFKSTDGGITWRAINLGLGTLRMSGFDIDPKTPSTLYVGGHGLFKSTDGGMSWRAIGTDVQIWSYVTFALDPQTPTTIYASGLSSEDNCGGGVPMYKSTDGGENWHTYHVGKTGCMPGSLAIDPKSPTTLYMVVSGEGLFKSTDGAVTWRGINTGLVRDEKSQPGADVHVHGLAIDPKTPTTLYATQSAGVFKSTDGGDTWRPIIRGLTDLRVFPLVIDPRITTTMYAGTYSSGVFKSTDGGETWKPLNMGLTNLTVWGLAVDPKVPTTIYAITDEGVFVLDQR